MKIVKFWIFSENFKTICFILINGFNGGFNGVKYSMRLIFKFFNRLSVNNLTQASAGCRHPRRPGFPNSLFLSWDSCFVSQKLAHQPRRPWTKTRTSVTTLGTGRRVSIIQESWTRTVRTSTSWGALLLMFISKLCWRSKRNFRPFSLVSSMEQIFSYLIHIFCVDNCFYFLSEMKWFGPGFYIPSFDRSQMTFGKLRTSQKTVGNWFIHLV